MKPNRFLLIVSLICAAVAAFGQTVPFSRSYLFHGYKKCEGFASTEDPGGFLYLTGIAEAQALTEKYSPSGSLIWSEIQADAVPSFIQVDGSGNVIIAGFNSLYGAIFVHEITSGGSSLWTYRSSSYDEVLGLVVDSSGNVYVAADRANASNQTNFDVIKLNGATGAVMWKQTQVSSVPNTTGLGLAESNGHLYSLCETPSGTSSAPYVVDAFNESTGIILWHQGIFDYGSVVNTAARQIYAAPNGDAMVIGTGSNSSSGEHLMTFYRIDATTGLFTARTTENVVPSFSSFFFLNSTHSGGTIFFAVSTGGGDSGIQAPGGSTLFGEIDQSGTYPFLKGTPGESFFANLLISNGLYATTGQTQFNGPFQGEIDQTLYDMDSSGNILKSETYTEPDALFPVALATSGGVVGTTEDTSNGRDGYGVTDDADNLLTRDEPTGNVTGSLPRVTTDAQDNMYVAGNTSDNVMFVAKISSLGVFLWQNTINFGVPGWTGSPQALQWFANGDVVLVATNELTNSTEVAKINSATGGTVWEIVDSSSVVTPSRMTEDGSGNVIVCGADVKNHPVVTSYSAASGTLLWQYNTGRQVSYFDFTNDSAGNFYVAGRVASGLSGMFVAKIDGSGNNVYTDFSPDPSPSASDARIAVDSAGNAYVGFTQRGNIYLIKLDSTGHTIFRTTFAESANDLIVFSSFFIFGGNLFMVTNQADFIAGTQDAVAYKVNPFGGLKWRNQYNAAGLVDNFEVVSGQCDSSGNLYLAGDDSTVYDSFRGPGFIVKIDGGTGKNIWVYNFANASGVSQTALLIDLNVTGDGKAVVVGNTLDPSGVVYFNGFAAMVK